MGIELTAKRAWVLMRAETVETIAKMQKQGLDPIITVNPLPEGFRLIRAKDAPTAGMGSRLWLIEEDSLPVEPMPLTTRDSDYPLLPEPQRVVPKARWHAEQAEVARRQSPLVI